MNNVIYTLLFLILVSTNPYVSNVIAYGLAIVLYILFLYYMVAFNKFICIEIDISYRTLLYALPFLIFLSWIYGVFIGLNNDVRLTLVISNFAGLIVFPLFYIFVLCNVLPISIVKIFYFASIVQFVYALYFVVSHSLFGIHYDYGTIANYRSQYSVGFLIVFPILSILVFNFSNIQLNARLSIKLFNIFIILALIFTVIVPASSKGFILAIVVLSFVYFLSRLYMLRIVSAILFITILFLLYGSVIYFGFINLDIIITSFSLTDRIKDAGNILRAEQFKYLVEEFSIQGAGLGAHLHSGYSRDATGYGFELSYLNVIHKLGVFSIPLFVFYILILYKSIMNLVLSKNTLISAFSFGGVLFLIPAIGNPIILSPQLTIMAIISYYLLYFKNEGDL